MLNRATASVVGMLIILVIVTGWYAASLTRFTPFSISGLSTMGTLSQVNVTQTTQAGAVQYKGNMQNATELNNGNVNFDGLNVTLYNQSNAAPWTLSADSGEVVDHNNQVNLVGHVVLSQPATSTSTPFLIQTDSASVYPNLNQVTGKDLITFSQPGTINQMQGIGFIANLQEKWIKLLSQVKGTYAPK